MQQQQLLLFTSQLKLTMSSHIPEKHKTYKLSLTKKMPATTCTLTTLVTTDTGDNVQKLHCSTKDIKVFTIYALINLLPVSNMVNHIQYNKE